MTLTTTLHVFLAGLAGGVLLEFLHWHGLRRDGKLPDYIGKPHYWLLSVAMAFIGGALAVLYFGSRADAIVAIHVGMSAPIILQKLMTTVAEPTGARGHAAFWSFLRW